MTDTGMTDIERRCMGAAMKYVCGDVLALAVARAVLAEAGVADLVEAGRAVDKWSLVILSAVKYDAPRDIDAVADAMFAFRAALAKIGANQ